MQLMLANPQIQQLYQQNPQAVQQLFSDPNFLTSLMQVGGEVQEDDEMYNKVFDGDIPLTEEQKSEVEEIVSMGFGTFEDAVQYYIAYDCNKEQTINALLNEKFED